MSPAGTVLDTNLICDLMRLDEWPWFQEAYGPLFVVDTVWNDELDDDYRNRLAGIVTVLEPSEEELTTSIRLQTEYGAAMSARDRATLAVAIHRDLRCGSNDGPMHRACKRKNVQPLRTLGVLSDANRAGIKTKTQCLQLVRRLFQECSMRVGQEVLDQWADRLR